MQANNTNRVNLVDLFLYLLSHWYWFVLCAALCGGYAYYKYAQKPFIYRSDATVIIKDPSNAQTTASMTTYSSQINRINMTNEILQLRSKQLMAEAVKALDADIDYTIPIKLRNVELYRLAPVKMNILRDEHTPEAFQLTVTTIDANSIQVQLTDGRSATVALGDTIPIYGTKVVFTPTPYYNGEGAGKPVTISKRPVTSAALGYLGRLRVVQSEGTILQLSLQDYSVWRASDILNMLITKYNEDAIREKNRIAVNTAQFINERLLIIQQELGGVEDEIARFKTSERIMNVDQATTQYLTVISINDSITIEVLVQTVTHLCTILSSMVVKVCLCAGNTLIDVAIELADLFTNSSDIVAIKILLCTETERCHLVMQRAQVGTNLMLQCVVAVTIGNAELNTAVLH